MNIAVIASCLFEEIQGDEKAFIEELLSVLSSRHDNLKFLIITGKQASVHLPNTINFELVKPGSAGKTLLQRKYWREIKLPRELKKSKADILVSFDGYGSVLLRLPQVLTGVNLLQISSANAKKAEIIAPYSEWEKQKLIKKYNLKKEKTAVLRVAVKGITKQMNEKEKEKIKSEYTRGKEYFLYPGRLPDGNSFIKLLKSFSHFKKRQKSSLKLLLFSSPGKRSLESLAFYKYREDVQVADKLSEVEKASLAEASYAVLVLPNDGQSVFNVLHLLQSGVPVLAPENSLVKEYAGSAALYFEEISGNGIAEKMIRIYTNEELRNQLISKGKERARNFSAEKSAGQLWDYIQKAVQ